MINHCQNHRDAPGKPRDRGPLLTIGVDFHGVIVEHPAGSRGITQPDWPEVPGAVEWLVSTSERFNIHVVSARFSHPGREGGLAVAAARSWLAARGVPLAWMMTLDGIVIPRIWLTPYKPACHLWVDDRAWRFDGTFPTVDQIESFRPWNRP